MQSIAIGVVVVVGPVAVVPVVFVVPVVPLAAFAVRGLVAAALPVLDGWY